MTVIGLMWVVRVTAKVFPRSWHTSPAGTTAP